MDVRPPLAARWRLALVQAGLPLVVLLLLAAAGALWAAWHVLKPTPDKRLVFATGPEHGAYEQFAQRYLPLLQAQGIEVTLRRTQGAAENLALLQDPSSGVQVAFVQGGVLTARALAEQAASTAQAQAPGSGSAGSTPASSVRRLPLVSLGSVAVEPLWLFYRSGRLPPAQRKSPPDQLSQLAGWPIDVGPVGGGAEPLFRQIAAAHGLPPEGLVASEREAVHRVVDLVQGRVDALTLVSAPEAPLVQYLLQTPGVVLFDWAQSPALARQFPFLQAQVLPRGLVDLARDQPPKDVRLVAATASLVVHADLHPALMQLLLQAAAQAHAAPGWFNRGGEFPNADAGEWTLADEAIRHYRSGPPFLQRYLPFWLANFLERMWIVLLPLAAVVWPLSRVVPPLVTMGLRSRVYRWYANLRALERALDAPGSDPAALLAELDRLDAQTERIGLPLSFTHELYELRAHIHGVRKRITARLGTVPHDAAATPGT